MRKFISFILILTFFSFSGCNPKNNNTTSESESRNSDSVVLDESCNITNSQEFILLIEVEKNQFKKNEEVEVFVSLQNESDTDVEIAYFFLFTPYIPTACYYPVPTEMPPEPYNSIIRGKEKLIVKNTLNGWSFELGKHEIKYSATFYLNFAKEKLIEIWSNTIQIEIID